MAAVLARHSSSAASEPGASLAVTVDRILLDGEGGLVLADAFHRSGRDQAKHGERVLLVHGGRLGRRDRPSLLAFGREHGASMNLDPVHAGWPSAVAVEEGFIGCDDVICAQDPEACALGGMGTVVLRVSPEELASLLRRRTLEVTVPGTVHVAVQGRLPRWVGPFDVAVAVLAAFEGVAPLRGRVVQLTGDAIAALSLDDRMTLCATLGRAGVSALVPPDESTRVWLAARRDDGGAPESVADVSTDADADDATPPDALLDARKIELSALADPFPGKPVTLGEAAGNSVDMVILGGRLADLRVAAEAMSERPLAAGLQLCVIPASRRVLVQALEEGLVTAFVRAGASILPPGSSPPTAPRKERRVTTVPTGGSDLLCGPAVAGASALAGRLVDPETVRREVRRGAAIR